MFCAGLKESHQDEIDLSVTSPAAFTALLQVCIPLSFSLCLWITLSLKYFYCDVEKIESEVVMEVFFLSHMYELSRLVSICERTICSLMVTTLFLFIVQTLIISRMRAIVWRSWMLLNNWTGKNWRKCVIISLLSILMEFNRGNNGRNWERRKRILFLCFKRILLICNTIIHLLLRYCCLLFLTIPFGIPLLHWSRKGDERRLWDLGEHYRVNSLKEILYKDFVASKKEKSISWRLGDKEWWGGDTQNGPTPSNEGRRNSFHFRTGQTSNSSRFLLQCSP